jgi:hypothetical protein
MNKDQGKKLTEAFGDSTVKLVKKSPKENGWKYFAINVSDKEHAELTYWLEHICLATGLTKKRVIQILVQDKYDEIKRIKAGL